MKMTKLEIPFLTVVVGMTFYTGCKSASGGLSGTRVAHEDSAVSDPVLSTADAPEAPFQIIRNDESGVEIQLGKMPWPRAKRDNWKNWDAVPLELTVGLPSGQGNLTNTTISASRKINIPASEFTETGAYSFTVQCDYGATRMDADVIGKVTAKYNCWQQDVFIYSPADREGINRLNFSQFINEHAPVIAFNKDEQYFPATLDYIFNFVDTNPQMAREAAAVHWTKPNGPTGTFQKLKVGRETSKLDFAAEGSSQVVCCDFHLNGEFSELVTKLHGFGHKDYLFDMGYQGGLLGGPGVISVRYGNGRINETDKAQVAVYYSIIPSRASADTYYLNFHFLYAYDSKGGELDGKQGFSGVAGHAFDRESATMKVRVENGVLVPVSMLYGAHLPDQTMARLDKDEKKMHAWTGGAVEVPWMDVIKAGADRPIIPIAHGSHGVYPKEGFYGVYIKGIKMLTEYAGGGDLVFPTGVTPAGLGMSAMQNVKTEPNYTLLDLGLMAYNPQSTMSALAFSGYWVTILMRKADAKFPPFTNRETDPDAYSSLAGKAGDGLGGDGGNRLPTVANW